MRSYIASQKKKKKTITYDSILSPLGGSIDRVYLITIIPFKIKCLFRWILTKIKCVFLLNNG
jgi:hypothetical protein